MGSLGTSLGLDGDKRYPWGQEVSPLFVHPSRWTEGTTGQAVLLLCIASISRRPEMLPAALLLSQGWGRSPGPQHVREGRAAGSGCDAGWEPGAGSESATSRQPAGITPGTAADTGGTLPGPIPMAKALKEAGGPECWVGGQRAAGNGAAWLTPSLQPHPIPLGPSHPTATSPPWKCFPTGCCQIVQSIQENPGNVWAKLLNQQLHLLPSGSPWLSPPPPPQSSSG